MDLSTWVRDQLRGTTDWRAVIRERAAAVLAGSDPERARELGHASEQIEPDRRQALALFQAAARAGDDEARREAWRLAGELAAHDAIAELALADHAASGDPAHLVTAGAAWIDAGQRARAVEPLTRAAAERAGDLDVKALLAIARGELRDPHAEVSRSVARAARAARPEQVASYLHAARVARASGLDELYAGVLATASKKCPDDAIVALVEQRLLARRSADDLVAYYRARFEDVTGEQAWVRCVQVAALQLVTSGVAPGLGLRLLRTSLEHGYAAKLADLPRHLASWELLRAHARASNTTRELLPLIDAALDAGPRDDTRLYLALAGMAILRPLDDATQTEREAGYASIVIELEPAQPAVAEIIDDPAFLEVLDDVEEASPPPTTPPADDQIVVFASPGKPAVPPPLPVAARAAPPPIPAAARRRPTDPGSIIPRSALSALIRRSPPPPPPNNPVPRAHRAVVPIDVEIVIGDARLTAIARDLSTTGVFLVTGEDLALQTVVTLHLQLPGTGPLAVVAHQLAGRLVRRTDAGYGVAFVDPAPATVAAIAAITERE